MSTPRKPTVKYIKREIRFRSATTAPIRVLFLIRFNKKNPLPIRCICVDPRSISYPPTKENPLLIHDGRWVIRDARPKVHFGTGGD
jgi:hypothetical protein